MKVTDINIPGKWRIINQDKVKEIAKSFEAVGQLNAILINNNNELVAGRHRLEAVKVLGWDEVEVKIAETDDELKLELINLDENLCRQDLTPIERAQQIARQVEIYNTLNPDASKRGGDNRIVKPTKSAIAAVATKLGVSTSTVKRNLKTAKALNTNIQLTAQESPAQITIPTLKQETQDNEALLYEAPARPSIAEQIRLKQQGITEVLPPAIIKKQLTPSQVGKKLLADSVVATNLFRKLFSTLNASQEDLQLLEDFSNHVIDLININYGEN